MSIPKKDEYIISEMGNKYRLCEDAAFKKRDKSPTSSMGIVKKVWDETENRYCFLKFAYKHWDKSIINNLKRESKFIFYYPYIEHVINEFDARTPDGTPIYCVSFEYIDGLNLEEYRAVQWKLVQNGRLKEEEFEQNMFQQMMQFLYGVNYYMNFARGDPFLHRDLKPENIMIDKKGKVIIVDFDYSHESESKSTKNLPDHPLGGTKGYTDPRTVRSATTDIKSDIYSIGRIFFFWLNGKHYFESEEGWDYCSNDGLAYSLEETRFKEKKYLQNRYKKLIEIIRKMCIEPDKRYGNVADIIKDMNMFLLEYYGNSMKKLESYIQMNKMPLLQKQLSSNTEKMINVHYKILLPGESKRGHPLLNHTMRNITINNKLVMIIYNLDGTLYYIPYMKNLVRTRQGKDFKIYSGDQFTIEGTTIEFWI